MSIKVGDYFYSKTFIGYVEKQLPDNMYGVTFCSRDGSESSYNILSPMVLESIIDKEECVKDHDIWNLFGTKL